MTCECGYIHILAARLTSHLRRVIFAGFTEKSFCVVLGSQCRIRRSLENCVVCFISLSLLTEVPLKKHFCISELVMLPVFMRHAWVHAKSLQTCLTLCDPMDHQAPLSSRHEYWSRLPCPPLGDLSSPGIEPMSFMSPALAGFFFTTNTTWKAPLMRQTHSTDL